MQRQLQIDGRYVNERKTFFHHPQSEIFRQGMADGIPIAMGYFTVAFTLGIAARSMGIKAFQGFLASLLTNASVGQFAGFALIASGASFGELILVTLIANARFALLSCSLSQKFAPGTPLRHRLLVGFDVTDELFGITIARPDYLEPFHFYGAMLVTIPCWAGGTALGITAGNILPLAVVSALSVALYGMFLVVIVPPGRKNPVLAGLVLLSFLISYGTSRFSFLDGLSSSTRIVVLTVAVAGLAAVLFPLPKEEESSSDA